MASKFTPERQQLILEALRENPSVPSAASKAGISPVTLNRWLQRAEEGNPEFAEFALEAAEARCTMHDEGCGGGSALQDCHGRAPPAANEGGTSALDEFVPDGVCEREAHCHAQEQGS